MRSERESAGVHRTCCMSCARLHASTVHIWKRRLGTDRQLVMNQAMKVDQIKIEQQSSADSGAYLASDANGAEAGKLTWTLRDGARDAQHTIVPSHMRGHGIAARLVEDCAQDIEDLGLGATSEFEGIHGKENADPREVIDSMKKPPKGPKKKYPPLPPAKRAGAGGRRGFW